MVWCCGWVYVCVQEVERGALVGWVVCLGQVVEVEGGGKVGRVRSGTHLGEEVRITHSCLCLANDVQGE